MEAYHYEDNRMGNDMTRQSPVVLITGMCVYLCCTANPLCLVFALMALLSLIVLTPSLCNLVPLGFFCAHEHMARLSLVPAVHSLVDACCLRLLDVLKQDQAITKSSSSQDQQSALRVLELLATCLEALVQWEFTTQPALDVVQCAVSMLQVQLAAAVQAQLAAEAPKGTTDRLSSDGDRLAIVASYLLQCLRLLGQQPRFELLQLAGAHITAHVQGMDVDMALQAAGNLAFMELEQAKVMQGASTTQAGPAPPQGSSAAQRPGFAARLVLVALEATLRPRLVLLGAPAVCELMALCLKLGHLPGPEMMQGLVRQLEPHVTSLEGQQVGLGNGMVGVSSTG